MRSFAKLKRPSMFQIGVLLSGGLAWQAQASTIQTVFVIAMENHNWSQPASQTSPAQILGNPAAPVPLRKV
jgi:hypothetical protein